MLALVRTKQGPWGQSLASTGCTACADRIPDPAGVTMITDIRPFSRLPSNDPFEQFASPRAKGWDVVGTSKFLQPLESQASDIRKTGIAVERQVHAAVRQGTLHRRIARIGL
jgi:hypothetical protein